MELRFWGLVTFVALSGCLRQQGTRVGAASLEPVAPADDYLATADQPIFKKAQALGRGVNLGNALEAPHEGAWGITLRDEDFTIVAHAGFDHVRIPVRWSAHASEKAPFKIDSEFAARAKWAVDSALAAKLKVVLNVHHYEELTSNPDAHKERFLALWHQIAESYRAYPDTLYFEILNEPHDRLTADKNNALIVDALAVVRRTNPERAVVVGSVEWNAIRGLPQLELPADDKNLIVTIHNYDPFDFTHQGAEWAKKQDQTGIGWPGNVGTQRDIAASLNQAVAWARAHARPLYLGEFGAYEKAEFDARVRWTTAMVQEARARAIPYAYWELRSGFGLYDLGKRAWRRPLLDAVLPPQRGAK
jgi:endoglucanase